MVSGVGLAMAIALVAGLSTGIGGAIVFVARKPGPSFLSFVLGFPGGVMICISSMELLPEGISGAGEAQGVAAFFLGMAFFAVIDALVPESENPHEYKEMSDHPPASEGEDLGRVGIVTALAVGIHNFPEGLATFGTALYDLKLGVLIAAAIAIHNIPEGISVSVPIFYSTNDRKKAFMYSLLSGIAEPVGALAGLVILAPFLTEQVLAGVLAFVAGVMVFISLDEILPVAHRFERGHVAMLGIALGMFTMAATLSLV
jgi:ZIP family zinc transporter